MQKLKHISLWLIIVTLVLGLVGCAAPVTPEENVPQAATESAFPLTLTDGSGTSLTLEKAPTAIVSLSPSATEILFAIGKGDLLKGRTDFCNYPPEAANVASVGSITEPNLELIAAVKPDLVLISDMFSPEIKAKIQALGIQVFDLSSHDTFEGVYTAIDNAGKITNATAASTQLVSDMKAKVADVTAKVANASKTKVYYVVGFGEYGDYTAGKGTFIDQMIAMSGGENVAQDTDGWKYSLEKLIEKNPELIICSKYYDSKKGIEAANGYKDLDAVKNGKLVEIDNDLLDRQGPRSADGLLALAKLIHPELF